MSWIRRLFRFFKEDETETFFDEQIHIEHTEDTQKANRNNFRVSNREVEARVAYQYPKGNFRFPLIPDEKVERKRPAIRTERARETREAVPLENTVREESMYRKKKEDPVPIRKYEKATKGTRPFKPTEIPSPIYGFNERPKTDLNHPNTKETYNSANKGLSVYESEIDTPGGKTFKQEADIKEQLTIEPEAKIPNQSVDLPIVDTSQQMASEPEMVLPEPTVIEPETVLPEPTASEPEMVLPEPTVSEPEMNAWDPMSDEPEQDLFTQTVYEAEIDTVNQVNFNPSEETLNQTIEPIVDILGKETDGSEDLPVHSIHEEVKLDTSASQIDDPVPLYSPEQTINVQEVEEKEQQKENEIPEKDIQSTSGAPSHEGRQKSTIPFNVIMLNNDKQNLLKKNTINENDKTKWNQEIQIIPDNDYSFPSVQLLNPPVVVKESNQWIEEQKDLLNVTLQNFNVGAHVVNVTQGPAVTRFEVQPDPGVKVNKITNLSDDIKLSLAAKDIRIEAPIPGKHTVGIEVPNKESRPVLLSEILNNQEFIQQDSPLTAALGLDISGKPVVTDLRKMPHGLIAGATGSGKSVCINTILISLLYKAKPEELKLLLIDPKMVELAPYNHIPHLVSPVITDVKAATAALKWAVEEMERRYELFAHTGVREIGRFNELAEKHGQYADKLPYIVIIIDELADLMMMSPADVEEAICRIAQKARACGIHLIIATQRPSVDVITGLIKANIPTRIAFSVSSQVDSRTIIDMSGAEKLLGKGDMLFLGNGTSKPVRIQGTFVSDEEIDDVVSYVRDQGEPDYLFVQEELLKKAQVNEEEDELFYEACEFIIENGGASTSLLQRRFKIGYNRAARLIDMMEQQGFISEARGSKPRDVLITDMELETLQETGK